MVPFLIIGRHLAQPAQQRPGKSIPEVWSWMNS